MRPTDVNTSAILSYLDRQIQDAEAKLSELRRQRTSILELAETVANTTPIEKAGVDKQEQRPRRIILMSHPQATAGDRIRAALKKMKPEFTSKDILDEVNRDGGAEMPRNTFAPEFSKLLRENILIVVRRQVGNKPGIYRLNDE